MIHASVINLDSFPSFQPPVSFRDFCVCVCATGSILVVRDWTNLEGGIICPAGIDLSEDSGRDARSVGVGSPWYDRSSHHKRSEEAQVIPPPPPPLPLVGNIKVGRGRRRCGGESVVLAREEESIILHTTPQSSPGRES